MANTFKNALARNIGTSAVSIYTAPSGKNSICIELDVCNTTASGVTCDVYITKNTDSLNYYLVKSTPVPVGGSLQVVAGQKIVLTNGDILKVISSVASSLDVVGAILEDV
jgi:hypothetical protein